MPDLRQESLHLDRLPLEYLSLIRHLDRFITDSSELKPRKDVAEPTEIAALRRQHDELMAEALQFFGATLDDADLPDSRWALALGLYRCSYYESTVLGDVPLVDTCGSLTIGDFRVDTAQGETLRAQIGSWLDVDQNALADAVEEELDSLHLRHAIVAALEERHPLAEARTADAETAAMFDELYPGHPFRPGEIDIIRTSTSVFFCLPFEDLRMLTPQWDDRSVDERREVEAFLRRWSKFKQRYYAHFPVFGFFRGDQADPELLSFLAEKTGVTEHEVADALTTMVSILQSKEVDKYIVHDAWGHQWQSLLFRFEETYREVATYQKFPAINWQPEGHETTFAELVRRACSDGVDATIGAYDAWLRAAIEDRLLTSLAGLVAEVLADVVEYKFILLRPEEIEELLSSSFLKDLPTKLDLTLWDIPFYFKLALKGFERFVEQADVRDALAGQFGEIDRSACQVALDGFAEHTSKLLDFDYRRTLHYEVEGDGLIVNAFCRVALNFLAMQSVFNDVYERLRAEPAPTRPEIERFHDVMVFATASFFELDWREHFWLVDEFLGEHFVKLWAQVRDA